MEPDGDAAFHRNEAISAVQDVDQYYGDDDDFDDLYNDVNVGDGFLHNSSSSQPPPSQQLPPPSLPPPLPQKQPPSQQLPPPPQQQQPPPQHSLPPPPPLPQAPPPQQQKVHIPGVAAPAPNHPPSQPNLPPPAAPAPLPPQQHQIQQGGGDGFHRPGGNYGGGPIVVGNGGPAVVGGDGPGGTTLFVGELHWWTTDADLEAELIKYGPVKEVRDRKSVV